MEGITVQTTEMTEGLNSRFREFCERYSLDATLAYVAGVDLIIHPRVYRAEGASTTSTLLKALGEPKGLRVLDMGCGSGIIGVIAALRGASQVVLADVSPDAVANAEANVEYHGLAERCRELRSDLFESLDGERFDRVMFNMPFWYLSDHDGALEFPVSEGMLRAIPPQEAFVDVGYSMIRRFMSTAANHLKPTGVIRCSFASFGNFEALDEILSDFQLERRTVAETVEADYDLKYLAFELAPQDRTP